MAPNRTPAHTITALVSALFLVALAPLLCGCEAPDPPKPREWDIITSANPDDPALKVVTYEADPDQAYMDALITADLGVIDGCLVFVSEVGFPDLPAFPSFTIGEVSGNSVTIDGSVYQLGDSIEIGGGAVPHDESTLGPNYTSPECGTVTSSLWISSPHTQR